MSNISSFFTWHGNDNGNEYCFEEYEYNKKSEENNYIDDDTNKIWIDDDYDEWCMRRKYARWMQNCKKQHKAKL